MGKRSTRPQTKRERLIELAENIRDCFDCNGDPSDEPCGSERGISRKDPYPHDDVISCWHCFARWALGEREPEWIDARPDGHCGDEECAVHPPRNPQPSDPQGGR